MKLKIDDYEITISARYKSRSRATKQDTVYFLNTLSIYATEAAKQLNASGATALAEEAKQIGSDIYEHLLKSGAYKDIY